MEAKANVGVHLKPEKAQTFVIAMALMSTVAMIALFSFLWAGIEHSWVPGCLTLLFAGMAVWAWHSSHEIAGLEGATPTVATFTTKNSSIQISTDARTIFSPEAVKTLNQVISMVGCREPVPTPCGLVDDNGDPIPNSQAEAAEQIRLVNAQAEEIARKVAGSPAVPEQSDFIVQDLNQLPEGEAANIRRLNKATVEK